LQRVGDRDQPSARRAADFTYVWTGEGWLFVAVVLDLYSLRLVGWSMQPTMTAQLVMDAVTSASTLAPLHHLPSKLGAIPRSREIVPFLASGWPISVTGWRINASENNRLSRAL